MTQRRTKNPFDVANVNHSEALSRQLLKHLIPTWEFWDILLPSDTAPYEIFIPFTMSVTFHSCHESHLKTPFQLLLYLCAPDEDNVLEFQALRSRLKSPHLYSTREFGRSRCIMQAGVFRCDGCFYKMTSGIFSDAVWARKFTVALRDISSPLQ